MLEAGEAVEDHRQLHLEAAAFGGDLQPLFERRLLQPLPLLAPRLQILLQPGDAVALQPPHVTARVVQALMITT